MVIMEKKLRPLPRDIRIPPNIRPRKNRERFYIDNIVLTVYAKYIKTSGLALYNVLSKHANSVDQCCWPTYETLMKESAIGNRNTVIKYLRRLERYRLIWISRKNKQVNIYCLLRVLPIDSRDNLSLTSDKDKCQKGDPIGGNSDTGTNLTNSENELGDLISQEETNKLKALDRVNEDVKRLHLTKRSPRDFFKREKP